MRFRTPTVFGLSLLISGWAGCAATRHTKSENEIWSSWKEPSSATLTTPYQQYGVSVSPYKATKPRPELVAPRDEFDFTHPRVDSFVMRFQTSMRGYFASA